MRNSRKLLSLCMALALTAALAVPAFAEEEAPSGISPNPGSETTDIASKPETTLPADVAADAWYADAVGAVIELGMMQGVNAAGDFNPAGTVTRAEVVQILYNAKGKPAEGIEKAAYNDLDGKWYADAVHWAAFVGIVEGQADGGFHGDAVITRAELAQILYNYAKVEIEVTALDGGMSMKEAPDYASIPEANLEAMTFCYYGEVLVGDANHNLNPGGDLTRAEMAKVMVNLTDLALRALENPADAA